MGSETGSSDDDVPKLPRGRGITLSVPQLVRILGLIAVLVVLLVMQKPCSNAVSKFVTGFDGSAGSGSAGSAAGSAAPGLEHYERLRPGMTEAEVKAVIERARVKAAGAGSAGSAAVAPETTMPGTHAPSR